MKSVCRLDNKIADILHSSSKGVGRRCAYSENNYQSLLPVIEMLPKQWDTLPENMNHKRNEEVVPLKQLDNILWYYFVLGNMVSNNSYNTLLAESHGIGGDGKQE